MVSRIRSLGLYGIRGYEVSVECFLSGGLPAFEKVGYRVQTHQPMDFDLYLFLCNEGHGGL